MTTAELFDIISGALLIGATTAAIFVSLVGLGVLTAMFIGYLVNGRG